MIDKVKEWVLWLWDWGKRIFGRSKIIFLQVVGIVATGWVEIADPLSMFNWDQVVDKHETAVMIQIAVQLLTMLLRAFASGTQASFSALPKASPEPTVDPNSEEVRSPKAD